jgi:hypothetical protein
MSQGQKITVAEVSVGVDHHLARPYSSSHNVPKVARSNPDFFICGMGT